MSQRSLNESMNGDLNNVEGVVVNANGVTDTNGSCTDNRWHFHVPVNYQALVCSGYHVLPSTKYEIDVSTGVVFCCLPRTGDFVSCLIIFVSRPTLSIRFEIRLQRCQWWELE